MTATHRTSVFGFEYYPPKGVGHYTNKIIISNNGCLDNEIIPVAAKLNLGAIEGLLNENNNKTFFMRTSS